MVSETVLTFRWIIDQQKAEGVNPREDVYIILRLDGCVRRSGRVSDFIDFLYMFRSSMIHSVLTIVPISLFSQSIKHTMIQGMTNFISNWMGVCPLFVF
jgi:hypothetical protein